MNPVSEYVRYPARLSLASWLTILLLSGCTVGPDYQAPKSAAPDDWVSWRSGDNSLHEAVETQGGLPAMWWSAFGDPVLDRLQQRAFVASPNLQTAALHFAQARVQRGRTGSEHWPQVNASGSVTRNRQSEWGAGTRVIDALVDNRQPLIDILSTPFNYYQAGFDASWEVDLWGRVRRSIEAADADVAQQTALLELARLSLSSDVARNYLELRTTQRQLRLLHEEVAALTDRVGLLEVSEKAGAADNLDVERQRGELAALKSQLPLLLTQESASANQISLLLGERPGALRIDLAPRDDDGQAALPDLTLGLPSEVAARRPDIRAAEARLRRATAKIGVAQADLYPSVRIGASFGLESYLSGEFADWASRSWSVGPSITLPIFDRGRRKGVVELRELEQQEAAVNYQHTVLKAWQEIDDALNAYSAGRQRAEQLAVYVRSTQTSYELAQARYDGGAVDFSVVIDSQRTYLQARREQAANEGRMNASYVTVNKAIGNVPLNQEEQVIAAME